MERGTLGQRTRAQHFWALSPGVLQSHRRSPRCGKQSPGWRQEVPSKRQEWGKMENSGCVLGQPETGAVPRKNEIMLEKRQRGNFQDPRWLPGGGVGWGCVLVGGWWEAAGS